MKKEKNFFFQIEQYKLQKNKIEILQQTVHKLKSDLSKFKKQNNRYISEIQILKQKELSFKMTQANYMKKLRHSKKETLNIKKRLKLALTDMDKQSKYYEQQITRTENKFQKKNNPEPQRISLFNETSKDIDFQWDKCHGLLVNVKYKPSKVPSIRKSITSPTPKFDMEGLSPISASPTPSPQSTDSHSSIHSPREAYKLYVHRMNSSKYNSKQNGKVPNTRPKLIK
eukprot:508086_1